MGTMTRATLISEALEEAGNTGLAARAIVWLQTWLNREYARWPWSFLQQQYGVFSIASGAEKVRIGGGTLTADYLTTIRKVLLTDPTTGAVRDDLEVVTLADAPVDDVPAVVSATSLGDPTKAVCKFVSRGVWDIYLSPRPSGARGVVVLAQYQPADLSSDSAVPLYPNDETMMQAIIVRAFRHMSDERYAEAKSILRGMLGEDRAEAGGSAAVPSIGLSRHVFK